MHPRLLTGLLVAAMAMGSLALWIAIPVAWLWLPRHLEPAGTRFLVTITGCTVTMVAAGWALYRLEAIYIRTTGAAERGPGQPMSLLDLLLTASAVIAIATLVFWWVFLGDSSNPSGPLQPL
jgi:xanthine/uracil permease